MVRRRSEGEEGGIRHSPDGTQLDKQNAGWISAIPPRLSWVHWGRAQPAEPQVVALVTIWEARKKLGIPQSTKTVSGGGETIYFYRSFLAESTGLWLAGWLWAPLNKCWLIRKAGLLD